MAHDALLLCDGNADARSPAFWEGLSQHMRQAGGVWLLAWLDGQRTHGRVPPPSRHRTCKDVDPPSPTDKKRVKEAATRRSGLNFPEEHDLNPPDVLHRERRPVKTSPLPGPSLATSAQLQHHVKHGYRGNVPTSDTARNLGRQKKLLLATLLLTTAAVRMTAAVVLTTMAMVLATTAMVLTTTAMVRPTTPMVLTTTLVLTITTSVPMTDGTLAMTTTTMTLTN